MKTKTVICSYCNAAIQRPIGQVNRDVKENNKTRYCSKECKKLHTMRRTIILCGECNKEFLIKTKELNNSKSGKGFCSRSCAASYNNKHKKHGTRRSKLENFLETLIKEEFPDLEFLCNNKTIIESELDFYFPTLNLAIEINGIFHYEPIYGKDKLTSIQNNDKAKLRACDEKKIDLLIISDMTSRLGPKEKEKFKDSIILIIQSKL